MNRHLHSLSLFSFIVCLITSLSGIPVLAEQIIPLPDTAVAGYHPGFFTRTNTESIPPLVNTYENNSSVDTSTSPAVNFSFFPGDEKGQQPSLAGFVSGTTWNVSVNISGRRTNSESYQFLATVTPNNQGIFIWPIPDWAKNFTEFIAELAE